MAMLVLSLPKDSWTVSQTYQVFSFIMDTPSNFQTFNLKLGT
ncbi:MAG TPA: hypothetical protein PLF42_10900 [Anaerolineales bacterium]|nr:hypothetical protein [Anaerolineales bacterium]